MNVAFIPARGGSKSIPLKNIKNIAEKPLVYWTAKAASDCNNIDLVYIATDSKIIGETVLGFKLPKVRVIGRSKDTATDTASTESVMIEFAQKVEFDNIILIQATSPLLRTEDIEGGFNLLKEEGTDSVLSVVRQKRFYWENIGNGLARPTNYNFLERPRRQDFQGNLVENGAFYITSKERLLTSGCRISGNIRAYEMDEETYFEIDEQSDWVIIEQLLKRRLEQERMEPVPVIKLFLTDCDGCLTDGGMYYSETGDELKKFNTRDGMGFGLLKKKGILTGIVTSENVELNRRRAEKLNIDFFLPGCLNKAAAVKKLCEDQQISLQNVAYIGDDINDLELLKIVGYGCCPADSALQVKNVVKYITKTCGGRGVIREVAEKILGL